MLEGQLEMKRVKESFSRSARIGGRRVWVKDMLYPNEGAKGLKEFRKPSRVPDIVK